MSTDAHWPDGVGRIDLPEIDSTNAEAARRAPTLRQPTWVFALRQTGAKGRRGKAWAQPPGSFAATLVMKPPGGPGEGALRSFMAANALYEALALHIDRTKLALKWPNDVLLNGGKMAGILLESSGTAERLDWLAVGIGVNLGLPPDHVQGAAFPPVGLAEQGGKTVLPEDFLAILASSFATQEALLAAEGFAPIRAQWLAKAARLGEVITARTGTAEITGRFDTIDDTGCLVLTTPDGARAIPAADVYF
ncbi:MAG: biotin--[acetyl-CoA-carboxylase] ligase [Rhodobacteraceae bacterium]|nr:biotin--[acetyl-CoA-carboxylase] ligase [Paracoccaceae bacterium]